MALSLKYEQKSDGIHYSYDDNRPAGIIAPERGIIKGVKGTYSGWRVSHASGDGKFWLDLGAAEYQLLALASEADAVTKLLSGQIVVEQVA